MQGLINKNLFVGFNLFNNGLELKEDKMLFNKFLIKNNFIRINKLI